MLLWIVGSAVSNSNNIAFQNSGHRKTLRGGVDLGSNIALQYTQCQGRPSPLAESLDHYSPIVEQKKFAALLHFMELSCYVKWRQPTEISDAGRRPITMDLPRSVLHFAQ